MPPPIVHPPRAALPVLLSVPHAGRDYSPALVAHARGGRAALEGLEDPLVDLLVGPAIRRGIGAVIARAPRAAIDCNRAEDEIDPAVVRTNAPARASVRARGGLGIVPGRTATQGSLWRAPIDQAELEARLDQAHRPFHAAIAEALESLLDRFGCALLLDCHSMPSPAGGPDIVIGDRYGRTAARRLTADAMSIVRAAGYSVALNDPFAGGHVVERHGAPARGIHALQLEIDRRCYLAEGKAEPGEGFAAAAALIEHLATALAEAMLARGLPAAAE